MIAATSIGAPRRSEPRTSTPAGGSLLQASDHRAVTPRLWLALYLPRFPLEVLGAERAAILPVVVISGSGAGSVVIAAVRAPNPPACMSTCRRAPLAL